MILTIATSISSGCRLQSEISGEGIIQTESGAFTCSSESPCTIKIETSNFKETFVAVPGDGWEFVGWSTQERTLCRGKAGPCTFDMTKVQGLENEQAFLDADVTLYLRPIFQAEGERRIGFEILEIQSLSSIRAWISPDITFDEFDELELPAGWRKNQPRESAECGPDASRFLKSPDAEMNGDISGQELFGFNWFHAATVTQTNIQLDDEGLLTGSMVRKFHELTYNAGSCLVLLTSPEGEVYFRIGRDANRSSDEPSIPNLWRLEKYTTPEKLVIELFEENLVIRTDNEDSFQGPVPQLGTAR